MARALSPTIARIGRVSLRLAAGALLVAALYVAAPVGSAAAAVGCNGDLCITTNDSHDPETSIQLTLSPNLQGYYHVHVWATRNDFNTSEVYLSGLGNYTTWATLQAPVYKGVVVCAELWRNNGSGYDSWGRPCITQ